MAGSLVSRLYESDNGQKYFVTIDESNAEALYFAVPGATPTEVDLPKGMKMRYLLGYFVASPTVKRKLYIGSRLGIQGLSGAPNTILSIERYPGMAAEDFKITYLAGETRRIKPLNDTGINDGDDP